MKFETTFLGKYFYIGNYKGDAAANLESELEALKKRIKAQAIDMFEDQLDALVNNKTAPARPAGPPARRVAPPARPKMPRWMVLSEHVQVTDEEIPHTQRLKLYKDGKLVEDHIEANISVFYPLKWSEKTPDRLYIPDRTLYVSADEFKAHLDGTLTAVAPKPAPARQRRAPVVEPQKAEEPSITDPKVRAKTPVFSWSFGDIAAVAPDGTEYPIVNYESTCDVDNDPEHIYWIDRKTAGFAFKTVID